MPDVSLRVASAGKLALLTATAAVAALLGTSLAVGGKSAAQAWQSPVSSFWIEELASGLNFPSSMAWLPNGDMLIGGQDGTLRRIVGGKLISQPVSGVPATYPGFWNGVREVVVDPDFARNHIIYLLLVEGTVAERRPAVYRARLEGNALRDPERIFRSKQSHGGAGVGIIATRMILLKDGTLLIAAADERHADAQQWESHLGKTLRINRDGTVPKDNPGASKAGALPEIWTLGHRATLGLYQDPKTGEIWETEAGPRGGDELNQLKAGSNYGWSKTSWGFAYGNNGLDAPYQTAPGITDPVNVWTPSVTPAGLIRYRGSRYPGWDGDFLIGQLTAKTLERLRIQDGRVVLQERLLNGFGERIRDVKVGPDGYIYLLTDSEQGRLVRLHPGQPDKDQFGRVARKLDSSGWRGDRTWRDAQGEAIDTTPGDPVRGRQLFTERCSACHAVGKDIVGGKLGPDLDKIYGKLRGRQPGYPYSANMQGAAFAWDHEQLNRYIADPAAHVAGTTMTTPPIADNQVRRDIVGYLKQQSERAP